MPTENSDKEVTDTFRDIKQRCKSAGISLSKLCREANVDRSILERWKFSEPPSIATHKRIDQVLKDMGA